MKYKCKKTETFCYTKDGVFSKLLLYYMQKCYTFGAPKAYL